MATTKKETPDIMEHWRDEEIHLIRDTVAQQATDEELKLFLYTAKARGLDPLLKQIYFIKRKQKRGERWVDVGTVQTGIDGFRLIANRTKMLRGIERGTKRDETGKLYAWARVWRKDWDYPAYEEVSLEEYRGESVLWQRMPEQMLKKCAEVAALRMAFPEDLSGLYAHEEMDQAEPSVSTEPRKPTEEEAQLSEKTAEKRAEKTAEKSGEQGFDARPASLKQYASMVTRLQQDYGLSKEQVQDITGLRTFKGASPVEAQKAVDDLMHYCEQQALAGAVKD